MAWTTKRDELRTLISDGPNDRLRHRKRVLGLLNGTNITFKTFEAMRLSDFTTDTAPVGVYLDGVQQTVATDNKVIGEFTLAVAPADDGKALEATYYAQWFLDSDLDSFLLTAAQWLQFEDADQIPPGLRPAALHYCAQAAYMKLSIKWAEHISETYRLEDAPKEDAFAIVTQYQNAASQMNKKSFQLRDDFYEDSGRRSQVSFGTISGRVRDPMPKR